MKHVAVLGGGPAGAIAAGNLAQSGADTVLIDEKMAWEKPCGGGLTYKAYSRYPFLINNNTPKNIVRQVRLSASSLGSCMLSLTQPIVVYSRTDLNAMLLERASKAGAQLEKARVLALERAGKGWRIRTSGGEMEPACA